MGPHTKISPAEALLCHHSLPPHRLRFVGLAQRWWSRLHQPPAACSTTDLLLLPPAAGGLWLGLARVFDPNPTLKTLVADGCCDASCFLQQCAAQLTWSTYAVVRCTTNSSLLWPLYSTSPDTCDRMRHGTAQHDTPHSGWHNATRNLATG